MSGGREETPNFAQPGDRAVARLTAALFDPPMITWCRISDLFSATVARSHITVMEDVIGR